MAKKFTLVSEEEAEFLNWVSAADTVILECRVAGHRFPGITDGKLDCKARVRQGGYELKAYCEREAESMTCGTELRKIMGSDGILEHAVAVYDHDRDYRLPAGVAEANNHQLSRRQRGLIRKELVRRREQAQAARERKARRAKPAQGVIAF
jgi:hypothetical protein